MRKVKLTIFICAVIISLLVLSGFRLSPRSAAGAHSFLGKDFAMVKELSTKIGNVYIYKVNDYYLTIMPTKFSFLWRAPFSTTTKDISDKEDNLRTIGWGSYTRKNDAVTVMVVEVQDNRVAYIEAGPQSNRERQRVRENEYVVYVWDKALFDHDVQPLAYSESGQKLYSYNSIIENNTDTRDLRWHRIN